MSSSITARFQFTVAGDPVPFANPFAAPTLALAADPVRAGVAIAASGSVVLTPGVGALPATIDFLVLSADQDCTVTVVTSAGTFTLPLTGNSLPLVLPAGLVTGVTTLTSVTIANLNTLTIANLEMIAGQLA